MFDMVLALTQAAAWTDERHRESRDDLFKEHRRQEQRQLQWHKARVASYAENRQAADARYVARLKTIDAKRERAADALHRRHNSLTGKMAAMTRKGRKRQAADWQRLDDREHTLKAQATRQHAARQERQFKVEQRDRIARAREMKAQRQDHLWVRQNMDQTHDLTRASKIEVRVTHMREAYERDRQQERERQNELKQGLKNDFAKSSGRTLTRTFNGA